MNTYNVWFLRIFEKVAKDLLDDLGEKFGWSFSQELLDEENFRLELLTINPEQGYSNLLQKYPTDQSNPLSSSGANKRTKVSKSYVEPDLWPWLIDTKAKDQFLELVLSLLEKIIFMEDPGFSIPKTVLYLAYFEPKTIGFFLERLKRALANINDLSFATVKSVLIFLVQPVLHGRKQVELMLIYYLSEYGLKDLTHFMEVSFKLFEIQGISENVDSLEQEEGEFKFIAIRFYSKILMAVPAYPREVVAEKFPTCSVEALEFCDFMSDFVYQLMKLVIKNLHLIKYKESDSNTILINLTNIFWPIVCNTYGKISEEIIQDLMSLLESELEMAQMSALGDLLDCLTYRLPEKILPLVIDLALDKLLKKNRNGAYEVAIANKSRKKLWLTLLEKTLTQAGRSLRPFHDKLLLIVELFKEEEEDEVFEKTCDIIHTVIMTNLNIVPTQLSWHNSHECFLQPDFHQKPAFSVKDFKVEWVFPDQEDWAFVRLWLERFMFVPKQQFESEFFISDPEYEDFEIPRDFAKLVDMIVFRTPPMDPKLKQRCQRLWYIIFAAFSAISLFLPFEPQDESMVAESKSHHRLAEIQRKYFQSICPGDLIDLRREFSAFVVKSMNFAIKKGIAHDKDTNEMLVFIAAEVLGCSVISNDLQVCRDYLEGSRYLNSSSQHKLYFDTRMQLAIDTSTYLFQRHLFLMCLQGAPKSYIQIYFYITVLFFVHNNEFQSPPYLLPFSESITYELAFGIRTTFFAYLLEVLDYTKPDSRLNQINAASKNERSKGYKQLQDLLKGFYSALSNIAPDIGLTFPILAQINKFITAVNYVEANECRNLIVEGCVQALALYYDQNTFDPHESPRMMLLNESISALQQNQLFWKSKVIHMISILNNLNALLPHFQDLHLLERFLDLIKKLSTQDHAQLSQLGRSVLFYLLRLAKQRIYRKEVLAPDDEPLSANEFCQWRFVTKTQKLLVDRSYQQLGEVEDIFAMKEIYRLKDAELFLMKPNRMIKTTFHENFQADPVVALIRQAILDEDFIKQLFQKVLIDKDVQSQNEFELADTEQNNQEVQFMSPRGITKYVQIFITYIYCKDKKKYQPFSTTQSFFLSDFYLRFFKKLFQVAGKQFFLLSNSTIEEYLKETSNREMQRICSWYLAGLQRSLVPVGDYIERKITEVLPHITQEIFYDYHYSLYFICKDSDFQWVFPLFKKCLDCCHKFSMESGLKGLRYIQIMKIFIQSQCTRSVVLQQECFYHFSRFVPASLGEKPLWASSTHIEEHVSTLSTLILQGICAPMPTKMMQQFLKSDCATEHLIALNSNFSYQNNKQANVFFSRLNEVLERFSQKQQLSADEEENQKNQQELSAKLLDYILITKFDSVTWNYVKQALNTVFENNKIEIDSSEILRRFVESDYTEDTKADLMRIINEKNMSENWLVRKKANLFLRDWYFKQLLEGEQPSIPDELMRCFDDKNSQLQVQGMHSLADYLKLFTQAEMEKLFNDAKHNVDIMMGLLMSRMDRVFKWTDDALSTVITNYQKNQARKKLICEFASEFWKSRQDHYNVFDNQISDENIRNLKEIVNPYSYFA